MASKAASLCCSSSSSSSLSTDSRIIYVRLAVTAAILILTGRPQLVDTQSGLIQSICQWETFNATCSSVDDVVVMTTARYGRMRVGRCVPVDYHIGCSADVTENVDVRCSGLRSCVVSVPDPDLFDAQPCRKDLIAYMEAAYKCIRPLPCFIGSESSNAVVNTATSSSGYLSGRCHGNAWQLRASRGQRIELTLFDYASPVSRDDDHQAPRPSQQQQPQQQHQQQQAPNVDKSFDDSCPPLIRITEKWSHFVGGAVDAEDDDNDVVAMATSMSSSSSSSTVPGRDVIVRIVRACDSPIRQRVVYVSRGHVVMVTVLSPPATGARGDSHVDDDDDGAGGGSHVDDSDAMHRPDRVNFLLHYQVTGCADVPRPENALLVRTNEVTVVWCNSTGERWHLYCRNGRWIGGMPTNCSAGTTQHGSGGSELESSGAAPVSADNVRADHVIADASGGHLLIGRYISFGMALAIILGCIVGLVCGIVIVFVVITFKRRRKCRKCTVEQPATSLMSDDLLLGRTTLQRQHAHIYGLLDVVSPTTTTTTLSPPEMTSSFDDDGIATTTTLSTRTAAATHHSCVCSCHEPDEISTNMDAGNNERSAETCSVERYGYHETDHRHLRYHHLLSQPEPSTFRIHSSAARRASSSEGDSITEVCRPLWMSNSSADQRCDCIH